MLKKKVTYTDYNDVERTEDFYFNLTEAEITEMELTTVGGFVEMVERIIEAQDSATIVKTFKKLVLDSYGVKSADGKRFVKNQEVRDSFEQNPAYSKIFMELAFDSKAAAEFVNGIIPSNFNENIEKYVAPAAK